MRINVCTPIAKSYGAKKSSPLRNSVAFKGKTDKGASDKPDVSVDSGSDIKAIKKRKMRTAVVVTSALAIGAIGVASFIKSKKVPKKQPLPEPKLPVNNIPAVEKSKVLSEKEEKPWLAILALAGIGGYEAGQITREDTDDILKKITEGDTTIQRSISTNGSEIERIKANRPRSVLDKYSKDFYGLSLLTQDNVLNKNTAKYESALKKIRSAGFEKLTSTAPLAPLVKDNPVIWSVTSEFAPVKEGGLGSVPPEIRNNAVKLGVEMPTFVPMYLNGGMQSLSRNGYTYNYSYKGKNFELEKLVDFKMDVFKNDRSKSVPVSIFLSEDTDNEGNKRQLLFVKCDEYFDGTIYEGNSKTEEPEKFAVMSKAVYEFAKIAMEGQNAAKDVEIDSLSELKKIKAPDALILNDWQASPIAALCRYKAPMENAYGQLSDETAKSLSDMRIITIGHNAMYQGSTQSNNDHAQRRTSTNNILNTLFDKYSYDIVKNAKLGVKKIDPDDENLKNLDNVLVLNHDNEWENHTNFLNMGIVLSDYFCPVSKNYARELVSPDHADLSYILQWPLIQKAKSGKMSGVINGNDFSGLSSEVTNSRTENLTGVKLETYPKNIGTKDLIDIRNRNKIKMYREYILPFSESKYSSSAQSANAKTHSQRLEFYPGDLGTELPNLSDKELKNTPVLTSGGRLVSQKGIDVLCESIAMLFDNWDNDFPGKPKPIFYIAGADGEGGSQRALIEKLKNEDLEKEDNDRVLFAHGFAPMTGLMQSSDFFLMPSKFEPCGLTQGESLAVATPVIASAVGGIVDTINRNGKENGILTTKDTPLDAEEFYKAMRKALDIYFDDKPRYNSMVSDSLKEDYSWIQPGRKGPVYDYLELIGIPRANLPEIK